VIEDLYGTMCIFVLKNTMHTSKVPECLRTVLLAYYAVRSGNFLLTFRGNCW